jgi:Cytochrome c
MLLPGLKGVMPVTAIRSRKEDGKRRISQREGRMKKQWIKRSAVLGCALLALSIAHSNTKAQVKGAQSDHQQTGILTLEGPAIHILVAEPLSRGELRKLVTDSRTAREHPDLAEYYQSKADRLQAEAEECQRIARTFGDPKPLDAPDHFNIGRNARHFHVIARQCLGQAQDARLLAAFYAQAAEGEGCFACHNLHGRGGKIAPDLAIEGTRGRSDAWLIGHFKDPQAYSPASIMPALGGLTNSQLEALAAFLQYQKEK